MDLLNFIIRIIAFIVSLIILLEFIVVCDVDTTKALLTLVVAIGISITGFFLAKRHRVTICSTCNHIMHQ